MQYRKEDLPKILILSGLLLIVLIYIIVSGVKLSRQHKARIAAEEVRHEALHQDMDIGATQSTPETLSQQAAMAAAQIIEPVPPPTRDPFHPIIPPRSLLAASVSSTQMKQPKHPMVTLPPLPGPEASEARTGPTLEISGIIVGSPSIAVLRSGEDHIIVKAGDSVFGRLRVRSIARNEVTLQEGKKVYTLRMGG